MERFALIKNQLIKEIDARSKKPVPQASLENTLKTLVKITPLHYWTVGSVYNNQFTFDISRSYQNLSQLYIKVTLSSGLIATTAETYLATKIFKSIVLKTKRGRILQEITPEYSAMRLDELTDSQYYSNIEPGLEPDILFDAGSPTVIVPLFFFFSEALTTSLQSRELEQLELECITNDSSALMGLDQPLVSINAELYALYQDVNTSQASTDFVLTKKSGLPSTLVGSYNIFKEDPVVVATGATSVKLLLRCPFPTFALHCTLRDATTHIRQIKTLKLTVGGVELVNLDYRLNYQIFGLPSSFKENGVTTYWFSRNKARDTDSGLIVFSEEMYPCWIDLTFDALDSDYTLSVFEEYRTNFAVSDIGEVEYNTSDVKGTMQQTNSTGAYTFNTSINF